MRFKFSLKILELFFVLYGSTFPGVLYWCYVGIPLVFRGVLLVFRVMFSCSGAAPGCSAGVPCSGVPGFIVCRRAELC